MPKQPAPKRLKGRKPLFIRPNDPRWNSLYEQALTVAEATDKASALGLKKGLAKMKVKIGPTTAKRLMDRMDKENLLGRKNGTRARKFLGRPESDDTSGKLNGHKKPKTLEDDLTKPRAGNDSPIILSPIERQILTLALDNFPETIKASQEAAAILDILDSSLITLGLEQLIVAAKQLRERLTK